ncbi:MAG TPA: HPr family phosphocarrier protein, partial [Gordonia polyisoprenivorans]|nr:HPr family phosphocarrier protein [Gordonia polyisoprenivorans]
AEDPATVDAIAKLVATDLDAE